MARAARKLKRRSRSARLLRALGLAVVLAIVVAYVQPLRAYQRTRTEVADRRAEVVRIMQLNQTLERRLALSSTDESILREARKLGLVRPGERLFIVKGVGDPKGARIR